LKIQNLTLSVIASAILLTPCAYADEVTVEPIIVTSDFRDKSLAKTSNAVTVLSTEQIAEKAHVSFENVIGQIPNVNFSTGGSRAHYIQIRGIGERSQFLSPVNPSVGLILDGIDVSDSALALTMFDVNQIEVLKGPQGTTFGSNGMAGVVSLQSNEPTEELEGHIETTIGNYNTKTMGLAVGGTLIENKLLGRFSIYKNTSDGFMENKYLNKDDTQNIDELTAKAQLSLLVNDDLTIDLNLLHVDVDNGYDAFTFDNSYNTYSDEPGEDTQKTNAFALKSTYQIRNKMHLISKVSYSHSDLRYSYDEDWSYVGAFSNGYSSFDKYVREREKIDIDLRLVSDEDGRILNDTTDWTFGVYYKDQSEDLERKSTYTSSYDTENVAIYGQLDSKLNQKLTLTTGLRVENWDAKFKDSDSLSIDTDEVLVGGKIGLSYQRNENNLYYTTLSKGYKPGGVNADNSLSTDARDFETEHLWNLDLGTTFSNLENKLISRVNFFYGLRIDQQVKSSNVEIQLNGSTKFVDYLANAAKSTYYGVEAQTDYYPNDTLHLFASVGLLKSKFNDYEDPNPSNVDVNGRAPAQSPDYQYNIGFDYMITSTIQLKADIEGKDSYYFSNRHNEKSGSYTLLNTSISYEKSNWTTTLWGKNLTDKSYQTRGFGSFGNNPGNGYATELYTQQGNPRTFGLTVGYNF
jgi:outer membrane receptor protein involved in Fe transport